MKYLRKFNESIEEKLYQKLEQSEFYIEINKFKQEIFTQSEIDKIVEFIKIKPRISWSGTQAGAFRCLFKYPEGIKNQHPLEIWKREDEWYFIIINNTKCFKCDSFDGLIQCMDDSIIKHRLGSHPMR